MNHHIILTSGRSGSNYLANTLNLHSQIVNYGEILASMLIPYKLYSNCKKYKLCNWSVNDYLKYAYTSKTFFYAAQLHSTYSRFKNKKPTGFKTWKKVSSLGTKDFFLNYHNKNALDFLVSNKDISIIHLYRENMLRRYMSGMFLNKTGIVSSEKDVKIKKVHIDLEEMINYLDVLGKEAENEKIILDKLKNHNLISIKYEDYFRNPESILDHNKQVFEFLGVEPIKSTSSHKKILPKSWDEQIENYDEFCACLDDTKYQKYLD